MEVSALIIGIGWIVFWLYWGIAALSAKKTARRSGWHAFLGARLALVGVALIIALATRHQPWWVHVSYLAPGAPLQALGLFLFFSGLATAGAARLALGTNWGMPMTEKQEPQLVTTGPYHYVRHPIYSGLLLMILGSALDVNPYWLLVLVVAAIYFVYSATVEEKTMLRQFPDAYPGYKAKTKMLIPFIL